MTEAALPIWFVTASTWDQVRAEIGEVAARFAEACGFKPTAGRIQLLPDATGALAGVLFGESEKEDDPFEALGAGRLATALPAGEFRFANSPRNPELAALGFRLGLYRYHEIQERAARGPDFWRLHRVLISKTSSAWPPQSTAGRDLVNAPANVLTPSALEAEARRFADGCGAEVVAIVGDELLERNFPLIHAVGIAADEPPRLVDIVWGRRDAPKVTLVGKGVVFDTGGLDIKPSAGMDLMKKDMGGAATALTLARLIVESGLDVRLRVLLPIVENSISAKAMRPSDVIVSRKGLSVEIGNTDAEGRLILADALTYACEETPDLLFDFATLTGAARVALGPDLPPFYTDDEALAAEIAAHATAVADPLWRLPLWNPYDGLLDSKTADLNSAPGGAFAGSITAALFLRRFAAGAKSWAHFDIYAWNPKPRPHGPMGGEIQAARALFSLLSARNPRASRGG